METDLPKVILAYSGGLDTSVILHWLIHEGGFQVYTFTAEIGQNDDASLIKSTALKHGAADAVIEDLREEFARDYVFPMMRANTCYEGEYLLGTSIARPLISKRLVKWADELGASAIAHGATGKGNDQARFELSAYALRPDIQVIAPWRIWNMLSRLQLLQYADRHNIAVQRKGKNTPPYSMDSNLLHISYEGEKLEDPWARPDESMWQISNSAADAPDKGVEIVIGFENGDAVSVDGRLMSPANLLIYLNKVSGTHAIGRSDIVENRTIGIKSRGCYEAPAATVLLKAHRAVESITLDREAMHLKDELMPRYAKLIYNGYWWSPEREMLQALIDESQKHVGGEVRLYLHKGSVSVTGRRSPLTLYSEKAATFGSDREGFSQHDAEGFIKLSALRLQRLAIARRLRRPDGETQTRR